MVGLRIVFGIRIRVHVTVRLRAGYHVTVMLRLGLGQVFLK